MRILILITGLLGAVLWLMAHDYLGLFTSAIFLAVYFDPIIQRWQNKLDVKQESKNREEK